MKETVKPDSSAGGWDRYTGDHFSKIIERDGRKFCLAIDRSGSGYSGYVVEYGAPLGRSIRSVEGAHGLITTKRATERLAAEMMTWTHDGLMRETYGRR